MIFISRLLMVSIKNIRKNLIAGRGEQDEITAEKCINLYLKYILGKSL
jgi:hypothetical protein